MGEITITVTGAAEARFPAELATVSLIVGFDGPVREPVFRAATEVANTLTAGIRNLHDPSNGPVTTWSSDQLRVWSDRPWSRDGTQLPLVHHAALRVVVEFVDVGALAPWLEAAAELEGVRVGGIDWTLGEQTLAAALEDVRTRAVHDAVAKARVYAAALDLAEVTARSISEPETHTGHERMRLAMDTGVGGGVGEGLEFTPDELVIRAVVEASFTAS